MASAAQSSSAADGNQYSQPWILMGIAVALYAVGFYLEFSGYDGNSLPGAMLVLAGSLVLLSFFIVSIIRQRASRWFRLVETVSHPPGV